MRKTAHRLNQTPIPADTPSELDDRHEQGIWWLESSLGTSKWLSATECEALLLAVVFPHELELSTTASRVTLALGAVELRHAAASETVIVRRTIRMVDTKALDARGSV